jgi:hypothetical protein
MRARRSAEGNGGNTLSYTCNVRARAGAHARAIGFETAIHTVDSVANPDKWLTTPPFETVAQTVATKATVASPGKPLEIAASFTWTIAGLIADAIHAAQNPQAKRAPRYQLQALNAEVERLRTRLIEIFAWRKGWRHSQAWFTPAMLARGAVPYNPWRSGPNWSGEFIDYSYCFRTPDRRAAALATNPYGLHWTADHPSIRAFCERYGLRATIPTDFPSWWFPGRTTLIVFTPFPEASQHSSWAQGAARGPP